MTTIEQRTAAFRAFEARSEFIADLIKSMGIVTNEFGTVMETDRAKLEEFYDAIEEYDADVKAIANANDADRIEAEAEMNQGHQALTDDE